MIYDSLGLCHINQERKSLVRYSSCSNKSVTYITFKQKKTLQELCSKFQKQNILRRVTFQKGLKHVPTSIRKSLWDLITNHMHVRSGYKILFPNYFPFSKIKYVNIYLWNYLLVGNSWSQPSRSTYTWIVHRSKPQ